MSVKFERVKAGDVLYIGTRRGERDSWIVKILSIDHANGTAEVSWNCNAPSRWFKRDIERLQRTAPKDRHRFISDTDTLCAYRKFGFSSRCGQPKKSDSHKRERHVGLS